jgi:hypothetical protein
MVVFEGSLDPIAARVGPQGTRGAQAPVNLDCPTVHVGPGNHARPVSCLLRRSALCTRHRPAAAKQDGGREERLHRLEPKFREGGVKGTTTPLFLAWSSRTTPQEERWAAGPHTAESEGSGEGGSRGGEEERIKTMGCAGYRREACCLLQNKKAPPRPRGQRQGSARARGRPQIRRPARAMHAGSVKRMRGPYITARSCRGPPAGADD